MSARGEKHARTCIGCGAQAGKSELVRIVRQADGSVRFDASGRAPGRGAYVCSQDCFSSAAKAKRVQRALRANVGQEDMRRIAEEIAGALDGGVR